MAVTALAIVLAGCAPNAATDATDGGTASASGSVAAASAASGAGPTEPVRAIAVDDWVTVVADGLNLRMAAGLTSPSQGLLSMGVEALVAAGPVEADGLQWYALASRGLPHVERPGCDQFIDGTKVLDCPLWFGWVAAADADGEPLIAQSELDCPDPPATLLELTEVPSGLRLPCFGGRTLTFDAYLSPDGPDRGCVLGHETSPAFLSGCPVQFLQATETPTQAEGPEIVVTVDESLGYCDFGGFSPETCPFVPFIGQWIEVEGLYDHPAAATCAAQPRGIEPPDPHLVVYQCRALFVVMEIRARD
jgi:hypothetical protein